MSSWWEKVRYCGAARRKSRVTNKDFLLALAARGWWTVYDPDLPQTPTGHGIELVGSDVNKWIDRLAGAHEFPAPSSGQRPPLSADSTLFDGRSVIQSAITGTKCLRAIALSGFIQSSIHPRPYVLYAARYRNVSGSNSTRVAFGTAGLNRLVAYQAAGNFRTATQAVDQNNGAVDTNPHVFGCWWDGTNFNCRTDTNSVTTSATAESLPADITHFAVGTAVPNDASIANVSIAEIIVLPSYPGAAIESQLIARVRAKYAI